MIARIVFEGRQEAMLELAKLLRHAAEMIEREEQIVIQTNPPTYVASVEIPEGVVAREYV